MRERGTYLPLMGTAVAVIWGLTFLSTKVAVREMGPMSLALSRFVIAVVTLIPIVAATKTSLRIERRDILRLAAAGFLGITLYFLFENNGIMRLSASESSIIVGTIPVLTLLIEIFVYKRKTRPVVVAGIVFLL